MKRKGHKISYGERERSRMNEEQSRDKDEEGKED